MHLTSKQNPKLKHIRALRRKKERQASGQFVVEGLRHVGTALEHGAKLAYVVYTPELLNQSDYTQTILSLLDEQEVDVFTTTPEIFADLAEKDLALGLLAVADFQPRTLASLSPESAPWLCAVTRPQDPGNVGTLLRTIDAAGTDGLILLDNSVDPTHPTCVRASMGALFSKTLVQTNFDEFKAWATQHGYQVYGTSAKGARDYREVEFSKPAILLLGSEREGLTAAEQASCSELVKLPMHGNATSLNVAVAGGILLYEMERQLVSRG